MSNIVKYWTVSLIAFLVSAAFIYEKNDEFYWFYIQLMDSKLSLILLGNLSFASYFLFVYIIQILFIGQNLMEAERLVSSQQEQVLTLSEDNWAGKVQIAGVHPLCSNDIERNQHKNGHLHLGFPHCLDIRLDLWLQRGSLYDPANEHNQKAVEKLPTAHFLWVFPRDLFQVEF